MDVKNEILNIEYHTLRILVRLINRCRNLQEVSDVSHIKSSTVFSIMRKHKIKYEKLGRNKLRVVSVSDLAYTDSEGDKVIKIPII